MATVKEYKKIVMKVGTNVLTTSTGELDTVVIANIVDQIAGLKAKGITVILITSGAVGAGKSIYKLKHTTDESIQRQVYSSIGQVKLMNLYYDLFSKYGLYCSQVLATKDDFLGEEHYQNMQNCFQGLMSDDIIPIVNENDVVSLKELMFTDNDELAALTAFMIQADALFLLTNVAGVFDGDPTDASSKMIEEIVIGKNDEEIENYILSVKSTGGRGGMRSKFNMARQCANKNINTHIANGKIPDVVVKIVSGAKIGTCFYPHV